MDTFEIALLVWRLAAYALMLILLYNMLGKLRELYEHWGTSICNRAHSSRGCEARRIAKRIERNNNV